METVQPSLPASPGRTGAGPKTKSPLPPAIWTSFAEQARWKSWALTLLFAVVLVQAIALVVVGKREPDVVLVGSDGKSTYLNRSIAGSELERFLTERRHEPSDVTVLHFTKTFLEAFLAANSSTIEEVLPSALSMLSSGLRLRFGKEAAAEKLVETVKAAHVRTQVYIESLSLEERQGSVLRLRATVRRIKSNLLDAAAPTFDRLEIDLVERVVPRTLERPDGLEIADYANKVL